MQSDREDNKQILWFSISPTLTQNIRVIFHETYLSGPEPNITKKNPRWHFVLSWQMYAFHRYRRLKGKGECSEKMPSFLFLKTNSSDQTDRAPMTKWVKRRCLFACLLSEEGEWSKKSLSCLRGLPTRIGPFLSLSSSFYSRNNEKSFGEENKTKSQI